MGGSNVCISGDMSDQFIILSEVEATKYVRSIDNCFLNYVGNNRIQINAQKESRRMRQVFYVHGMHV